MHKNDLYRDKSFVSKKFLSLSLNEKAEIAKSVVALVFRFELSDSYTFTQFSKELGLNKTQVESLLNAGFSFIRFDAIWDESIEIIVCFLNNIMQKYFSADFDIDYVSELWSEVLNTDIDSAITYMSDVIRIIHLEFNPNSFQR